MLEFVYSVELDWRGCGLSRSRSCSDSSSWWTCADRFILTVLITLNTRPSLWDLPSCIRPTLTVSVSRHIYMSLLQRCVCGFVPSQAVSCDGDWWPSSGDSLKLSARLNDERGNPSEVTAHVHHGSLCALIVLFKVRLYSLPSVSFLDNKRLRPRGKILRLLLSLLVLLMFLSRCDQIEFRQKSEWLTATEKTLLERKNSASFFH